MYQKTLYFFTASYPFGNAESFIEDEIHSLSKYFDSIEIIPLIGTPLQTRIVPDNVIVHNPIINSKKQQYTKGLFSLTTMPLFIKDFFKSKVLFSLKALKTWFIAYVQANNIIKSNCVIEIFKKIRKEDVCYFYWGKGCNMLSALYPNKAHYVSRFHGEWDLWEETSGNYGPIRRAIAKNLDAAVFISEKGLRYFRNKYPECKTLLYPLGSIDYGLGKTSSDSFIRIVSCSTVYPLKRVPLIFQSILSLPETFKIEWTHIGGGPSFDELRNIVVQNRKDNVQVNLIGNISHDRVMEYFKNNACDLFINLSTNEGVPVSIMEAISFNIPVVATNVGATSEIVSNQVGVLVSQNPSPEEVAIAIIQVLEHKSEFEPRLYWYSHYNAALNYDEFAQYLSNL